MTKEVLSEEKTSDTDESRAKKLSVIAEKEKPEPAVVTKNLVRSSQGADLLLEDMPEDEMLSMDSSGRNGREASDKRVSSRTTGSLSQSGKKNGTSGVSQNGRDIRDEASRPLVNAPHDRNALSVRPGRLSPSETHDGVSKEGSLRLTPVYFAYDHSEVLQDNQSQLQENARGLLAEKFPQVQVEGYADERGSYEYNLALGERRGRFVLEYLIGLGVQSERMSLVSFGEEYPAVEGHTEAAWERNRRVEFSVK